MAYDDDDVIRSVRRKRSRLMLVTLVTVLLAVGFIALILSTKTYFEDLFRELARDFGVACIISAFVTATYEVYVRKYFDLEKLSSLLETVYGSGVPISVWRRVTATVLARDWLRQNAELYLRISRDPAVSHDKLILDVLFQYELVNLTERSRQIPVGHALDEHIALATANLPRFVTLDTGTDFE